jgi:hypothetical protein
LGETASGGWSNDIEDDNNSELNPPATIRRGTRRAAEEIIATGNFY